MNNHIGMNFNEYINGLRVKYLLSQFEVNKDWERFTLEALGEQVGFSNRFSFLKAFKKETGDTPSAYLQALRKKQQVL
jgi:YesN/AraC family two-component response regulator